MKQGGEAVDQGALLGLDQQCFQTRNTERDQDSQQAQGRDQLDQGQAVDEFETRKKMCDLKREPVGSVIRWTLRAGATRVQSIKT
ncbi:MAG: hypothetical protein P8101_09200 [Candidatus Thiodiazotropha sp.]